MSKWTEERELRVAELCIIRQSEIDGTGNSNDINKRRNEAWDSITTCLNAEARSNFDKGQVKKKYQNLKSSAKFKIAENATSRNKTGGGVHIPKILTAAEQLLEASLGQSKGFVGETNFVESHIFPQTETHDPNQKGDNIFSQESFESRESVSKRIQERNARLNFIDENYSEVPTTFQSNTFGYGNSQLHFMDSTVNDLEDSNTSLTNDLSRTASNSARSLAQERLTIHPEPPKKNQRALQLKRFKNYKQQFLKEKN